MNLPNAVLWVVVLEITTWSLQQSQAFPVTISALACQQHDAFATMGWNGTVSGQFSARRHAERDPGCFSSLLLHSSDLEVPNLMAQMDSEDLVFICALFVCFFKQRDP